MATGVLSNMATVKAHEADPSPEDNRIAITTTLTAARPLTATTVPTGTDLLLRAKAPDRITAGSPFTFTFSITNLGSATATGVAFHDTLPPGMTLETLSSGWPACTPSRGSLLTGRYPRDFTPNRDVWHTVLRTDAVPIRQRDPSIPKRLAKVIDAALRDKPKIGFQTAAELKHQLEGVL